LLASNIEEFIILYKRRKQRFIDISIEMKKINECDKTC